MGRFLLRPRWLAGLALVLLVTTSFVRLGWWQLDRLQQRRAYEDLVDARLATRPADLRDVLATNTPEDVTYRRVVAEGTFDPQHEVILYGRTQWGRTGNHVLTPLLLENGTAVAVDRGWVPLSFDDPPLIDAEPPTAPVRVRGVLFPTEAPGGSGSEAGSETTFARVDLPALAAQVPYRLAPVYLLLESQVPGQGELPQAAPLPDPSRSPPHLSYAIQWFVFAAIAAAGFAILVRREHRRFRSAGPDPEGVGAADVHGAAG